MVRKVIIMEKQIIQIGDAVTLYSLDNEDIIEFVVGDGSFPGLDKQCIGKSYKDKISFNGETFEVQYIGKQTIGKTHTSTIKKSSSNNTQISFTSPKSKPLIDIQDFIVRTNVNRCLYSSHTLTPVNALVSIINQGIAKEYSFPGMYCTRCNKYYMYEGTYQSMKRIGYICCKVIKLSELKQFEGADKNNSLFDSWQSRSLLNLYGYTVDQNKNLTSKERHQILAFIIENNILPQYKIVNYIQGFIKLRKNNKNMRSAIDKWNEDMKYVLNYQKTNRNIRVRSLKIR